MNRLREIRVVKRVSQFRLRLASGIHQSKISLIENNLVQPNEAEEERLAQALGVRVEELFPETKRELGKNESPCHLI